MKRAISFILVCAIVVSVCCIGVSARRNPAPELLSGNVIGFDAKSTHFGILFFHITCIDDESQTFYEIGSLMERAYDDDGDKIWTYDLDAAGITLYPENQYSLEVYDKSGMKTHSLIFDTTCIGDIACISPYGGNYFDTFLGKRYNVDTAEWYHQDSEVNGPRKVVQEYGTFGWCFARTDDPYEMLYDYIVNDMEAAHQKYAWYEQDLIDEVAEGLRLSLEETYYVVTVAESIEGKAIEWYPEDSDLESQFKPGKLYVALDIINYGEFESGAEFDYYVYAASELPPCCLDGVITYDASGMELIDSEICYSSAERDALLTGSVTATGTAGTLNFSVRPGSGKTLADYSRFIESYESDGGQGIFYEMPVLRLRMRLTAESGVFTLQPTIRSAYDINRTKLADSDGTEDSFIYGHFVTAPGAGYGYVLGDVDNDGKVSVLDATAIQRSLAKLSVSAYNAKAADADQDAKVTVLDATAIQRYLAKLSTNPRVGTLM